MFGALLVLTLVTVGVSYLSLPFTPTVLVALAIASVKAALVAMFFMHLKGERPMVYWPLGLTAVLVVGLFASILWSEGDHLFGTRFEDAFGGSRCEPATARRSGMMSCPVCFGGDDPGMRESLNAGIGVLMGVTGIVLGCFARFFVMLARALPRCGASGRDARR